MKKPLPFWFLFVNNNINNKIKQKYTNLHSFLHKNQLIADRAEKRRVTSGGVFDRPGLVPLLCRGLARAIERSVLYEFAVFLIWITGHTTRSAGASEFNAHVLHCGQFALGVVLTGFHLEVPFNSSDTLGSSGGVVSDAIDVTLQEDQEFVVVVSWAVYVERILPCKLLVQDDCA